MSETDETVNSEASEMETEAEEQTSNFEETSQTSLVNEEKTEEASKEAEGEEEEDTSSEEPLTVEALKFPDDFEQSDEDKTMLGEFVDVMNKPLTNHERAQALVDLQLKHAQLASEKASEAATKSWTDLQETWRNEVVADKTVGGDKIQKVLSGISKLLDNNSNGYTSELRQVLDVTGAGNNPHMIRFLNTIAEQLNEGEAVPANAGDSGEISVAEQLYPSMQKTGA